MQMGCAEGQCCFFPARNVAVWYAFPHPQPILPNAPPLFVGMDNVEPSSHVLIECVDMKMLDKNHEDVAAYFRKMCSSYGKVVAIRVFKPQECVAVSFDTPEHALMAR